MNGVIEHKTNKRRKLAWLRTAMNGRMITMNSEAMGTRNFMLRSRMREIQQWEVIFLEITEHMSVPDCQILYKRKQAWDPLLSFGGQPLLQPQNLPGRVWCVDLAWSGGEFYPLRYRE